MENKEKVIKVVEVMESFMETIKTATNNWYDSMKKYDRYDYMEYIVQNNYIIWELEMGRSYLNSLIEDDKDVDFLAVCDELKNEIVKEHFHALEWGSVFNSTSIIDNVTKIWKMEVIHKQIMIYDYLKQIYTENIYDVKLPTNLYNYCNT